MTWRNRSVFLRVVLLSTLVLTAFTVTVMIVDFIHQPPMSERCPSDYEQTMEDDPNDSMQGDPGPYLTFISGGGQIVASFPGLPHLQLLIASSMQKRRGKAWGIFSRDTRHDRHTSSRLISTVKDMYETDLAFCASYEDGISAN